MDNTVTQVRQRDLISQGEPGQHAIVNQRGVKAPAIKSLPCSHPESWKKRDHEIELLLRLGIDHVPTNKEALNGLVLKVRSGEVVSAEQAVCAGFRVVQHGQPGHGVILRYGQLHQVEIPGLLASDNAPYKIGPQLKSKVIQCQRKIFDELLNSGIKHVFSEGLDQTLVPDKFEAGSANAAARDKIRACFSGYRPGDLLSPYLENLLYAGGCLIYGHLVAGVTLHPTITPQQVAKHEAFYNDAASRARFIANKFSAPPEDRHIFVGEVEQILMTKMKGVMQGTSLSVALVFGRDHLDEDLASHCKGADFSPAIYSKDVTTHST